jgi:hypothetical protein
LSCLFSPLHTSATNRWRNRFRWCNRLGHARRGLELRQTNGGDSIGIVKVETSRPPAQTEHRCADGNVEKNLDHALAESETIDVSALSAAPGEKRNRLPTLAAVHFFHGF